ncbi:MAG TPA: GAF domain-containing protein [Syntrophales bacterium]|nr:GAF domain-containing protein [Syntrophales bacterium]HPX10684.1 GAF domain-containing protein [Syntrophales bacterium]HQN77212.1 GAF domain-containing protein [Syntrophales bacterium]HQQ26216.1 GAF domain-containing protein [Syntrophales bacterium]
MPEKREQFRKKDYFSALYAVARAINASLDPRQVLEEITRCVVETMGVKACSVRLLTERGDKLDLAASLGLSEDYLRKGPVLLEESGIDREVLQGRKVWIRDVRKDTGFQYPGKASEEGILSVLALPLTAEGKAVGVLRAYTGEVHEFPDDEIRFLEAVADLGAIAIDHARLHEALKLRIDLMARHRDRIDDN